MHTPPYLIKMAKISLILKPSLTLKMSMDSMIRQKWMAGTSAYKNDYSNESKHLKNSFKY